MESKKYCLFLDYFNELCQARNITSVEVAKQTGANRDFPWKMSNKPTMVLLNRGEYLNKLAHIFRDSLSKLQFLAGINPWADKLSLNSQLAIWEFVERLIRTREDGERPDPVIYRTLVRQLFGGVTVEDNYKMLEILREQTENDEEDIRDTEQSVGT